MSCLRNFRFSDKLDPSQIESTFADISGHILDVCGDDADAEITSLRFYLAAKESSGLRISVGFKAHRSNPGQLWLPSEVLLLEQWKQGFI